MIRMSEQELWAWLKELDFMLAVTAGDEGEFWGFVTDAEGHVVGQHAAEDMEEAMHGALYDAQFPQDDMRPNRKWTASYKNGLPDSAFLYVRKDCVDHRDADGRSHPLACRELPVKNHMGDYDYEHVRNAIARAMVLKDVPLKTRRDLQRQARLILQTHWPSDR